MHFKFINSCDDYCHNIISYPYIFEKIKISKIHFQHFWPTFGYFIIFDHLFFIFTNFSEKKIQEDYGSVCNRLSE